MTYDDIAALIARWPYVPTPFNERRIHHLFFIVQSTPDGALYWSNVHGWREHNTTNVLFSVYSPEERNSERWIPPIGAEWAWFGGWFFVDETDNLQGPYASRVEAHYEFVRYCRTL